MKLIIKTILLLSLMLSAAVYAQAPDYTKLDGTPFDPEIHPDTGKFISSWKDHAPFTNYGTLVERDIFSKSAGDPLNPHEKGAVLTYLNRFTHGSLGAGLSTTPVTLSGEQIVFFFDSGAGTIESGGKTEAVYDGVGVLMPEGAEFTISNTGKRPLTMYIMAEPTPEGFVPRKEMVVRDTNTAPIIDTTGHWSHIFRRLFNPGDGTAWLDMGPVWYDAMTMGQPHSHNPGFEEIWFALEGDINILLGKKMYKRPAGSAYKVPPDYNSPHSNINATDEQIKMFWFIIRTVPEPPAPSFANLDGRPYNPETDPNIDMYIRSWKESMPVRTHGNLVERDVLTKCDDPMNPPEPGAVLKYINRFTYATLARNSITSKTTLNGEQELFYILSGTGTVSGGGETHDLYPGMAFLIPGNLEFSMACGGDEPLEMYLVAESTPDGFKPNDHIVVRDGNLEPFHTTTAHWVNSNKWLIRKEEGFARIRLALTVEVPPGAFAQPHSHGAGTEEVWCSMTDGAMALLGKQIRELPSGTAYMIPPNGTTPHANFNVTAEPQRYFYFVINGR